METREAPRRRRALALGALTLAVLIPATALGYDPALEQKNFAKIEERNHYEVLTPEFQTRLQQQNAKDNADLAMITAGDPERDASGNICMQRKNECAGDVRFYDWADKGYGLRRPVLFTARDGAVISGNVWRTRQGPAVKPGIVITTGSVQAPETLYWGIAATLAKQGYVVLTYDVQGQGRSDTYGEGVDMREGFPSQAGQPFYDGTEDALNFMLSTPAAPYRDAMVSSCGNAAAGVATSHRPKQVRREGEIDSFSGLRHAEPFNPFWDHVDPERIGIAGHSLGAGAVSFVGQKDPRVDAIAAWDNLGASTGGGSACPARPATRTGVPMTKPAIGFSNDYGLTQNPYTSDPNPQSHNNGFLAYQTAGVDSMQVNTRGGTHYEYSFIPGNTVNQPLGNATLRGTHMAIWYTAAWFDKYVKCPGADDPVACEQLADSHLLTDRWRDDTRGKEVDLNNDGNLFSFYLRSRFDFTLEDGSEAICDDLRSGCSNMAPDGDPRYPAHNYSYLTESMTADGVPAAPDFTDTDPDSPSADTSPFIKGTAPAGSTVKIYANATCSGAPEATGTAADFASPGLQVTVAAGSTTTFYGTATDAQQTDSACSSDSISYTQAAPGADPETQIDSGPSGPSADNDPSFTFSSPSDPGSVFDCRLDSSQEGDFAACTSPKAYTDLADGEHTFEVRAVDPGNSASKDATPAASTFTIDTTAPAAPVLDATDPVSPANENAPHVLGSAEQGSLVQLFSTDDCSGGAVASGTADQLADPGFAVTVADNSTTRFSADATDALGNTSGCSNALTYVEETGAPVPCELVITGTAGDDVLTGSSAFEQLNGLAGDDRLRAGGGDDCLRGGPGIDRLADGPGEDRVRGQGGNDHLEGGPGHDVLGGGPGNDFINGQDGTRDRIKCGPGGRDSVFADGFDRIGPECDRVELVVCRNVPTPCPGAGASQSVARRSNYPD